MAKDCSFDVVSEFDKQELVNAIDQVKRDITSRFDLKNSNSDVALEGDNNVCIGFEAVADQYGITKAGKLANYYAGICHYKLGNYEEAISYLKKFNNKDKNLSLAAKQLLGDAYIASGDLNQAVQCYKKVAKEGNSIISPMSLKKLGLVYEKLGENLKAIEAYKALLNDYPQSMEASDIEKYIARLEQAK